MTRRESGRHRRRGRRLLLVGAGIVLVLLLVIGAADRFLSGRTANEEPPATDGQPGLLGLFVEPDDGRAPVIDEIEAARSGVDVMVYLLTDEAVISALERAESRGVQVRVILEQHPYGGFGNPEEVALRLSGAGAEVKWASSAFRFSHVKTIIVDRKVALIMNLNLTRSSFDGNREFGVITTRPGDVEEAQAIFDADWSGTASPSIETLVVSPINSRDTLTRLIGQAKDSLEIYAEVVRDDEIVAMLKAAAVRGVEVRMIVTPDNDPINRRILGDLERAGVRIGYLSALYVHAKAVIVDRRLAYVGSENFTSTSLDENREIGIVIDDETSVERLLTIFENDYSGADLSLLPMVEQRLLV